MPNKNDYMEQLTKICEQIDIDEDTFNELFEASIKEIRNLGPYTNLNKLCEYTKNSLVTTLALLDFIETKDKCELILKHKEMAQAIEESLDIKLPQA